MTFDMVMDYQNRILATTIKAITTKVSSMEKES